MTVEITKGEAIQLLYNALPYSNQIKDLDVDPPRAIYFTWRSARYKYEYDWLRVNKVEGCILSGDDCSILLSELLAREYKTRI